MKFNLPLSTFVVASVFSLAACGQKDLQQTNTQAILSSDFSAIRNYELTVSEYPNSTYGTSITHKIVVDKGNNNAIELRYFQFENEANNVEPRSRLTFDSGSSALLSYIYTDLTLLAGYISATPLLMSVSEDSATNTRTIEYAGENTNAGPYDNFEARLVLEDGSKTSWVRAKKIGAGLNLE